MLRYEVGHAELQGRPDPVRVRRVPRVHKVRRLQHPKRLQAAHEAPREFLGADLIPRALHDPRRHCSAFVLQARDPLQQLRGLLERALESQAISSENESATIDFVIDCL